MGQNRRPLSTRIIDRIPQTVCLRSGINITLRNRHHVSDFWQIFSSAEYMALVSLLSQRSFDQFHLLDLGGGIGLFSLLIEHLSRIEVLPWQNRTYTVVEVSPKNRRMVEHNLSANLSAGSFQVQWGAAGQKNGQATLTFSKGAPWGNTITNPATSDEQISVPFVDVSAHLMIPNTIVKMDIEGAEFNFIPAYAAELQQVKGLIVEWHAERGSILEAEAVLQQAGLRKHKRSWNNGNRLVDLYLKD